LTNVFAGEMYITVYVDIVLLKYISCTLYFL